MARYKNFDRTQTQLVPVDFSEQILPGTFEDVLDRLVDRHLDLSKLDQRYRNDKTGAPAYDPRVLLKIILYAYSRGIRSSRRIEHACRTNILFMALSGSAMPDFTTITNFASSLADDALTFFSDILAVCLRLGLIDWRILAIDGCKLPANASREWSGTHRDLAKKRDKLKERLRLVLESHRKSDQRDRSVKRFRRQIKRIDRFLSENQPRPGKRGNEVQSNVTDNESAKIRTARGMIQGYNGVAIVDSKHQIVVAAGAYGTGQEFELLQPTLKLLDVMLKGQSKPDLKKSLLLADTGYFSEENLAYLAARKQNALIPDSGYRKRDPRYTTAGRYKNRINGRTRKKIQPKKFALSDFKFDRKTNTYICPNNKTLRQTSASTWSRNVNHRRYTARETDCSVCPLRDRCLAGSRTKRRNLQVINQKGKQTYASRMIARIDSVRGRKLYSKRMGIVEPVFANITYQKKLNRFTMRGRSKINAQWNLFMIVNNIEKIANFGPRRRVLRL